VTWPRLTHSTVVAYLALFVAMGGGALAATGFVGADGVLHGCVARGGALSVVHAGARCGRHRTAIAWNQTGRAGPPGLTGPTGPIGPTGRDGAACLPSNPACRGPQGPGAVSLRAESIPVESAPLAQSASTHHLADFGPFSAKYTCFETGSQQGMQLEVDGPSNGQFQSQWVHTTGDRATDDPNTAADETPSINGTGGGLPNATIANNFHRTASVTYERVSGTAMVYTPTALWQVTFHLFFDERSNTETCSLWGSAIPAS
jgi:hypothetical protein